MISVVLCGTIQAEELRNILSGMDVRLGEFRRTMAPEILAVVFALVSIVILVNH